MMCVAAPLTPHPHLRQREQRVHHLLLAHHLAAAPLAAQRGDVVQPGLRQDQLDHGAQEGARADEQYDIGIDNDTRHGHVTPTRGDVVQPGLRQQPTARKRVQGPMQDPDVRHGPYLVTIPQASPQQMECKHLTARCNSKLNRAKS